MADDAPAAEKETSSLEEKEEVRGNSVHSGNSLANGFLLKLSEPQR